MRNKDTYISVTITDDPTIKELNKKYRNIDKTTDVLSFKLDEKVDEEGSYLGDVVVNRDQAERQAGEYGNSCEEEIAELTAHGVLHLLGVHHEHDDHEDA
jgi:probable rRNA maturation factor